MTRTLGIMVAFLLALVACTEPPHQPRAKSAPSTTTTVPIDAEARLDEARASTLRIRSTSSCEGVGVGSGFIVSGGRLITNRHVVSGTSGVTIESWDGDPVSADVSGRGTWADLALLNVSAGAGQVLRLGTSDPKPGTSIHVFGYPGGRELTVTSGKVLGYDKNVALGNLGRIMRIDAYIEPGNSGGPVVDDTDRVVGVVYATRRANDEGLAVPVSTLRDVIDDPRSLRSVTPCSGFFQSP